MTCNFEVSKEGQVPEVGLWTWHAWWPSSDPKILFISARWAKMKAPTGKQGNRPKKQYETRSEREMLSKSADQEIRRSLTTQVRVDSTYPPHRSRRGQQRPILEVSGLACFMNMFSTHPLSPSSGRHTTLYTAIFYPHLLKVCPDRLHKMH